MVSRKSAHEINRSMELFCVANMLHAETHFSIVSPELGKINLRKGRIRTG